jgi:hypothetical protein
MRKKKPPRRYPIEWDESSWERQLWRPHTFRLVLTLIEDLARNSGSLQVVDELVAADDLDMVPYAISADARLRWNIEREHRRAVALTHAIHRTMRTLAREEAARIITQVPVQDGDGVVRRNIIVRWDRQKRTTADQLKALEAAVRSGSRYKIEVAWFGLTQRAREYLSVGYHVAGHRGDLDGYKGPLEVSATIIPIPMDAPELLAIILPYAVYAISCGGRPPVHPRDEALATVLGIFVAITGVSSAAACRAGHGEPVGPGADFVRAIETIFGTELMPPGSTHAVARARKRLSDATDWPAQIQGG